MLGVVLVAMVALMGVNLALAAVVAGLRWRNERTARRWARWEQRWHPRILELVAGTTTPEALQVHVREREVRPFLQICARFARRLTGEDRQRVCQLARPFLFRLRPDLRSRQAAMRARAVQTLGELGFADHAQPIEEALDDPSPLVAMLSARTMARHGDVNHIEAVVARLERFDLWSPAFLAAMLAAIGPRIAPSLRAELAGSGSPVRTLVVSARALALLRDVEAADIAAAGLRPGADPELLAALLRLVQALGRTRHLPAVRAMASHPDFTVRAYAMAALGRIGAHGDRRLLRRGIADSSPWVAIHAARALRQLGGEDELRLLAAAAGPRAAAAQEALTGRVA